MQDLLSVLEPADYRFLAGIIESSLNITDDTEIDRLVTAFEQDNSDENRQALSERLEQEIRYLGSSEFAYGLRYATGREPGVAFREIIEDVAEALKVDRPALGTDRERVEAVAEAYATKQFESLSPEEQQKCSKTWASRKRKRLRLL